MATVSDDGPDGDDALVEEARRFVGAPPDEPRVARDPVNRPMIHHWCQAIGDDNPAYLDEDVAARTRHDGIVGPPPMLGSWTLDTSSHAGAGPRDEVLRRLEKAGFTAVVATDYEHEYVREMRPGDLLSEEISIEELSERKDTALGTGYFVTVRHDYLDGDGELVGIARMRLLKFAPPPRKRRADEGDQATSTTPKRPRPAVNRDTQFFWDGVDAGELRIQRCASCGVLRHPPRPMCGACGSTDWDTVVSTGRGRVYSFAVHHHPQLPGIDTPHPVVLVELEEGVRLVTELTGAGPDELAIEMPVQIEFRDVDDGLSLPVARPARVTP